MGRALVIISTERDRAQAANYVARAPLGTRVEFRRSTRTIPQNDRMWALLTAISQQLSWHGSFYPPETWKDYFMHSLEGARFMPHEDGGMVPIGRRTSKLTREEHSHLMDLMQAFADRQGVVWSEMEDA